MSGQKHHFPGAPADLYQWCRTCQAATRTWTDRYGNSRCARHEPEGALDDDDD